MMSKVGGNTGTQGDLSTMETIPCISPTPDGRDCIRRLSCDLVNERNDPDLAPERAGSGF